MTQTDDLFNSIVTVYQKIKDTDVLQRKSFHSFNGGFGKQIERVTIGKLKQNGATQNDAATKRFRQSASN